MDSLIRQAIAAGATDLHIGQDGRVFFRILGRLVEQSSVLEKDIESILTQVGVGEKEEGPISIAKTLSDGRRVRIQVFSSLGKKQLAIRLLPDRVPELGTLGLPIQLQKLQSFKSGLILVCGAIGSGKSTSLAAMLQSIAESRPCHILSFEDPVEYLLSSEQSLIRQCELGQDFSDFSEALRSAVRSDPDVIMVGEMRDEATARAALALAETGHLVLSSLHASSASDAIIRLFDLISQSSREAVAAQLAASLRAVLYQSLVPHAQQLSLTAIGELLLGKPSLARLIREQELHQIPNIMSSGASAGMVDFDSSLLHAYQDGRISYEQALSLARQSDRFKRRLKAGE